MVSELCCGRSEEQTANVRGTAVIHCKYPKALHDFPKQLFKVENGSLQTIFSYGNVFSSIETKTSVDPRFSMNVNHGEEHVFTVTLINVSRRDEGLYFCAAHRVMPISYSLLFTEIQLKVTGDIPFRTK